MKTLLFLLLSTTTVLGSLKWDRTSVELAVHPLQGVAPVVFKCSNVGKEPVSITEIVVSCGCLVPKRNTTPILPGEKREVKVQFDLFNRIGMQRKTLTVKTSHGQSTRLTVSAKIPQAYQVVPTLMKFSSKSPGTKTARLKNLTRSPMPIHSVESNHKKIKVDLECIKEGFEYAVTVTPLDPKEKVRGVIRIIPEKPEGITEVKTFKFYVFASRHDSAGQK